MKDYRTLPADLPVPQDDGAADHLPGLLVPGVALPATTGATIDLARAANEPGRLIVYVYPRTGTPGEPLLPGWDAIPGARGCTPESCAFRDARADFAAHGARLMGLSSQTPAEQLEFAQREHIPYPILSDERLALAGGPLRLPTFRTSGLRLYKRLTLVLHSSRVEHVFYPVFPPDRHASEVLAWLAAHPSAR